MLGLYYVCTQVMKEATYQAELVALARFISKWALVAIKTLFLGSIWLTFIPLLVGILLDTILITPLLTPLRESPSCSIILAWSLGLLFLIAWVR